VGNEVADRLGGLLAVAEGVEDLLESDAARAQALLLAKL
jgi:hypothetical protein